MAAVPFEIPSSNSVVVWSESLVDIVLRKYMQTGILEVMDDKGGSNLLSASQYVRISHNVTVENINIYVSMKSINILLTKTITFGMEFGSQSFAWS